MPVDSPLVSVVVPTYNRAHLILDALNSVLNQLYRPLELIVVDDGSTDETRLVLEAWAKKLEQENVEGDMFFFRYVIQANQGGNPARNRGIQIATGKYIAFLDSDDVWHAEKLTKQMAVFQAEAQVGGVYCGLQHVFLERDQVQAASPRAYPSGDVLHQMLIHDVTAPTSTFVLRADVFENVGGFDEQLLARQDWDMWIRLAAHYEIGVVPEVLVDFREHQGTRTASNPQKEIDAYAAIMQKYSALRGPMSVGCTPSGKGFFYRRMGRVYFHHQLSMMHAWGYQLRAILSWPFVFDSYAALIGMLMPAQVRQSIHLAWNKILGSTRWAIRSH